MTNGYRIFGSSVSEETCILRLSLSSRKRGQPDSLPSASGRLSAKPCPTVKTQKVVNITLLSRVLLLQEYQEGLFTRPWPLHQ